MSASVRQQTEELAWRMSVWRASGARLSKFVIQQAPSGTNFENQEGAGQSSDCCSERHDIAAKFFG
jgi:hypothetical protein